jgi:hypothetical protein
MSVNPRAVSLVIILLILFVFPDPPTPLAVTHDLDDAIDRELAALELLNTTRYGDFDAVEDRWLNLTGLKREDDFAWSALGMVKERVRKQAGNILGEGESSKALDGTNEAALPIYQNVTGHIRGSWIRSKLEKDVRRPHLNMTALLPIDARFENPFQRNITGKSGDLRFDFSERGKAEVVDGHVVQSMKAEVIIADETSAGSGWSIVMYGQHFVESGHIMLTTSSEKYAISKLLPWDFANQTQICWSLCTSSFCGFRTSIYRFSTCFEPNFATHSQQTIVQEASDDQPLGFNN